MIWTKSFRNLNFEGFDDALCVMRFKDTHWYLYNYGNHSTYDKDFEKIRVFNPKQCFLKTFFSLPKLLSLKRWLDRDNAPLLKKGVSVWWSMIQRSFTRYKERRVILKMNTENRLLINNLELRSEKRKVNKLKSKIVHTKMSQISQWKLSQIVPHTNQQWLQEHRREKITFFASWNRKQTKNSPLICIDQQTRYTHIQQNRRKLRK